MTLDEAIKRYTNNAEYERTHGSLQGCLEFRQLAEWLKDYKRLLEQEPCDDCISRQAVIDGINEYFHDEYYQRTSIQDCGDCLIEDVIKKLASVTPQPKTGHWITTRTFMHDGEYYCDKCKCDAPNNEKWDYCPNCGAKMQTERYYICRGNRL